MTGYQEDDPVIWLLVGFFVLAVPVLWVVLTVQLWGSLGWLAPLVPIGIVAALIGMTFLGRFLTGGTK